MIKKCLDFMNEFKDFEIYLVGGCVRDLLLGREVNDYDFATSATPQQVMQLFKHDDVIPTGLKHGTVTIKFQGEFFEVTTFRYDSDYSDGRRPDNVTFTTDIKKDLERRDFTINALAMSSNGDIIDISNGEFDLSTKIIRTVGNAEDRFKEDGLRILRGLRFASVLDFDISLDVLNAMLNSRKNLENIAIERIVVEIDKLYKGKKPYNMMEHFMGLRLNEHIDAFDRLSLYKDAKSLDELLILNRVSKEQLKLFKFSNEREQFILDSIEIIKSNEDVKILLYKFGFDHLHQLGNLTYVDHLSVKSLVSNLKEMKINSGEFLELSGNDLIKLGVKPGPEIGKLLQAALNACIQGEVSNEYEELLEFVKKQI